MLLLFLLCSWSWESWCSQSNIPCGFVSTVWLTEEGKVELENFFQLPYMHKFCFKFLPTFGRTLMFYPALYNKAKNCCLCESFYLKQLSISDRSIGDLGKRLDSSSGELQSFVVLRCKWTLQRAKFTAKQVNHCHSWSRSYLICCESKTKAVQNGIFQDPLAQLWTTTVKEWCGAVFENKSFY